VIAAVLATPIVRFAPMTDPRIRIALPDDERGRAPDTIRRFERLQRKLANPKTPAKERDAILAELEQIERAPLDRADAAWSRAAIGETEALARARGETVASDRGLRRVLDRDPLLSLARSGHLKPDQLEVGQLVRDLYDRRAEGAGAIEYTGMPSASHNHEAFVARAYARAKACAMLGRIERQVAARCRPPALTMLRVVCERGHSIRSQASGGKAFERNAAGLAAALDVADDVLKLRT
jgi:hypothetical protein